jgi:hypothetical protein
MLLILLLKALFQDETLLQDEVLYTIVGRGCLQRATKLRIPRGST